MSSEVTRTWAGSPSRIATREGPWDSPAVSQRSMASVFHGRYGVRGRSPGREMPGDEDAGESPQQQERAERQRLAQRGPLAPADRPGEAHEREEHEPAVEAEQPRRDAEEAQREPEERREPDVAVPEPVGPDPPQRVRRQERERTGGRGDEHGARVLRGQRRHHGEHDRPGQARPDQAG